MAIETATTPQLFAECIPHRGMSKRIGDSIITTVLSENPLNPLSRFSREKRRDGWGKFIPWLFPASFSEGEKPKGLIKAEELVKDGYGLVIASRHFSSRDFLMLTAFVRQKSELTQNREIYVPLAFHQYTPGAIRLLKYHGVTPRPIVTEDTVAKHKNFDSDGNERKSGEGTTNFMRRATIILNEGGVVFLAPSAKRTLLHEPWEGRPIETFVRLTKGKLAIISVGFDIGIGPITSYEKFQGYNLWLEYKVGFGGVYTKEELVDKASQQGISVDRLISDDIAKLTRPEFLGGIYVGGAGGNEPSMTRLFPSE